VDAWNGLIDTYNEANPLLSDQEKILQRINDQFDNLITQVW